MFYVVVSFVHFPWLEKRKTFIKDATWLICSLDIWSKYNYTLNQYLIGFSCLRYDCSHLTVWKIQQKIQKVLFFKKANMLYVHSISISSSTVIWWTFFNPFDVWKRFSSMFNKKVSDPSYSHWNDRNLQDHFDLH